MASKGERTIESILKKNKIDYKMQHSFEECRDRRSLPFDFLVLVRGRYGVIEYDGRQHFEVVDRFHAAGGKSGEEEFQRQKLHDITKNCYCRDNNISMLRIPYKDDANIEGLVLAFIQRMRTNSKRVEMFSRPEMYSNPYGSSWCVLF